MAKWLVSRGVLHFFRYFVVGLTRQRFSICEGCEHLYLSSESNETEDMVVLCPKCWAVCLEDGSEILLEDVERSTHC